MSISKRQFSILQTMGIDVWQRRCLTTAEPTNKSPVSNRLTITMSELQAQTLFSDTLLAIGVKVNEVQLVDNQLDLGVCHWCFCPNDAIELVDNCMITPPLSDIASSTALKKSLWHTIQQLGHQ